MSQENKTFAQFSERLTDLNLKSTSHRNKHINESNDQQPSALESLLEQLKKQTDAVKETLSNRSTNQNQDFLLPKQQFISAEYKNNKDRQNIIDNSIDIITQAKSQKPITQSVKIEDDLSNDFKDRDQYQSNNYLSSIPLSTSVLANNSSIHYNQTFGRKSDVIGESPHSSQLNADHFNELKKKSGNLRTSKDSLKKSREGSGKKTLEKKSSLDNNNPMVVDLVESEGSDEDGKQELDYYSKSIKRTNNTNNIHDIPEEKGESDEEEDRAKEKERQRIEKEKENKRKQIEEAENENKKREEEKRKSEALKKQKRKEVLEKQKKDEELEKQKQKEKEELENQKRNEELEKQKEKQRKGLEREKRKEELEKKKKKDEDERKQNEKLGKDKIEENKKNNEALEMKQRDALKTENKTTAKKEKEIIDHEDEDEDSQESPKNEESNQLPPEYIDIQIEDIDDIPELPIEETNKNSQKNLNPTPNQTEVKNIENTTKPKEGPTKPKKDNQKSSNDIRKKIDKNKNSLQKTKAQEKKSSKTKGNESVNPVDKNNQFNPQRVRERIVKEMHDFDVNNPDLTKQFLLLRTFDGKDRHLIRTIPNYEKVIIELEGNKVFLQRRKAFLEKSYFKTRIEEDDSKNDFIIYLQKISPQYPKAISNNYAKLINKDQLFPKNYNYSNENLFNHSPKAGCPLTIGEIENISTFVYKYSLNLCTNLVESAISAFSHWRQVKCDGNSFYRVIMFSIIEQFIMNKDIEGLEMICNELHRINDFFKEKKIDFEPALIVFKLILDELSNDNVNRAYAIFCKAYDNMKNDMFDKTLILYLRNIISQYIQSTYILIEEEVKKTNAKLDKSYFMNYRAVLENNIEPELNIINMIKYIFDIDIEIFWMEGSFENPLFGHCKLNNQNKAESEKELNLSTIYLGFFYSSYYIIYPNKQHIESEILKKKMSEAIASFTQLVYIDKAQKKCGLCGRLSSKIYFLQMLFYSCVTCLREYIEKVLIDRAKTYALANFVGFECNYIYLLH